MVPEKAAEIKNHCNIRDCCEVRNLKDYHNFKVSSSDNKYCLQIGEAERPPGANDAMAYHNRKKFTTYDSDNGLYHAW